jgi:hypothetical protein
MAIGAIVPKLFFMAALTRLHLRQKVIGGFGARGSLSVTIRTCDAGLLDMELMREFYSLGLFIAAGDLARCENDRACENHDQHKADPEGTTLLKE